MRLSHSRQLLKTDQLGSFDTSVFITISDQDLPGEETETLSLFLTGTVAIPGDTDLDQDVDFMDFATLTNHSNLAGQWQDGDFNSDKVVNFADFIDLSNWFGHENAVTLPEGTTHGLVCQCLVLLVLARFTMDWRAEARLSSSSHLRFALQVCASVHPVINRRNAADSRLNT